MMLSPSSTDRKMMGYARPFLTRLEQVAELSLTDRSAAVAVLGSARTVAAGGEIVRAGEHAPALTVILRGIACRTMSLTDGRRQIIDLLLPGDVSFGWSSGVHPDHAVSALTLSVVADIDRPALLALIAAHPALAEALRGIAQLHEAVLDERIASLGRRTAIERLAHLLCEVFVRSQSVGLATGMQCALPLNQSDLADALGLSLVHTHRSLQALRARKLIHLQGRQLTILDFDALQEVAHFDPRYLMTARMAVPAMPAPASGDGEEPRWNGGIPGREADGATAGASPAV